MVLSGDDGDQKGGKHKPGPKLTDKTRKKTSKKAAKAKRKKK